MNNYPDRKLDELIDRAVHLNEAEELITISENLFNSKLLKLDNQLANAKSNYERYEIQKKAETLHAEYKKSLQEIIGFVRDTCIPSGR